MKNIIIVFSFSPLFVGCLNFTENKQPEIKCKVSVDELCAEIRHLFNADSVVIYSKKIKEELYFSEIKCPVVLIYNATTKTQDFKTLPTSYYQSFDNFEQIDDGLKKEGQIVAQSIIDKCNTTVYNDLIIEFIKLSDTKKPVYRFISHYQELLNRN